MYELKWLGPGLVSWYKDRGLSETRLNADGVEYEEVSTVYAGGVLIVDGVEHSMPIMHGDDWADLQEWLETLEEGLSYEEVMEQMEERGVRWYES